MYMISWMRLHRQHGINQDRRLRFQILFHERFHQHLRKNWNITMSSRDNEFAPFLKQAGQRRKITDFFSGMYICWRKCRQLTSQILYWCWIKSQTIFPKIGDVRQKYRRRSRVSFDGNTRKSRCFVSLYFLSIDSSLFIKIWDHSFHFEWIASAGKFPLWDMDWFSLLMGWECLHGSGRLLNIVAIDNRRWIKECEKGKFVLPRF
jgi:hypothetical protein